MKNKKTSRSYHNLSLHKMLWIEVNSDLERWRLGVWNALAHIYRVVVS